LVDVVFYSVHSERYEGEPRDIPEKTELDLMINLSRDGVRIEVRCTVAVNTSEASFVVDAASRFELSEDVEISAEATTDFVGKIGLMAVYPYLREAVYQAASKLRVAPPMLGLLTGSQANVRPTEGAGSGA